MLSVPKALWLQEWRLGRSVAVKGICSVVDNVTESYVTESFQRHHCELGCVSLGLNTSNSLLATEEKNPL